MFSPDIDVYSLAGNGIRRFDIAHADVFVQGGAGRAAGQCADLLAAGIDSVAAATHAAFYHLDADQFAFEALLFDFCQRVVSDKFALVEFDGPAQARLKGVGRLVQFVTVEAVGSFQAQGIARAQIAASGPTVISVASGIVMGNELRVEGQR